MKIVDPSFEYIYAPTREDAYRMIATAARNCYRSDLNEQPLSDEEMVKKIMVMGHHAIIEFADISVNILCDRGVTHELVRHRLCSFAQESTRYCNYSKGKFGQNITFIRPSWAPYDAPEGEWSKYSEWYAAIREAEYRYMGMLDDGATPQEARAVLPNSLAAKIAVKANMREWRQIFTLRVAKPAHPDMRRTMIPILIDFHERYPIIFGDIYTRAIQEGVIEIATFGTEEGEICNRNGCKGIIEIIPDAELVDQGCSCHLSAPCEFCMNQHLACPECGWSENDDA